MRKVKTLENVSKTRLGTCDKSRRCLVCHHSRGLTYSDLLTAGASCEAQSATYCPG